MHACMHSANGPFVMILRVNTFKSGKIDVFDENLIENMPVQKCFSQHPWMQTNFPHDSFASCLNASDKFH